MANKQVYFDGRNIKAVSAWDVDNPLGWTLLGGTEQSNSPQATVAYLYACIDARAKALAAVPFCIYKGDTEVENSDDYENKTGLISDPYRLFFLIEAALTCYGRSYLFKERNNSKVLKLQYLVPTSVTPKYAVTNNSVVITFDRTTSTDIKHLTVDDIVYMWLPDPAVELGEPSSYPLRAAMAAAGAINAIDIFAAKYFERGMVKATIFGVPATTSNDEKARIENWVNKQLAGIKNAWRNIVASVDEFKPTVIGGGLDEVKNIAALTDGLQASITYAMGIPETYLKSGDSGGLGGGGVASADVLKFYDNTIIPECKIIQGVLNEQVFKKLGLRFEFEPERLPVYQRDIAPAINALATLINSLKAGLSPDKLEAAINIVGLDVSEEDLALLLKEEPKPEPVAPPAPPMAEQAAPAEPDEDDTEDEAAPLDKNAQKALIELGQWQRFKARHANSWTEFECKYIDATLAHEISTGVKTFAQAEAQIQGVTETPAPEYVARVVDYSPLLAGIDAGIKALDVYARASVPPQISVNVTNTLPGQPAPVVEVKAGDVMLPAPVINVTVPEQAAPVVNVAAPVVNVTNDVQPAAVKIPAPSAVEVVQDPKTGRTTLRPVKGK